MTPELGWPPCRRHGRGFRRATCGPLLRVAGTASSWKSVPRRFVRKRRSAPFVTLCSARLPAIVHSSALSPSESGDQSEYGYDRPRSCSRCVLPWSGFDRFGLQGALPPKLNESRLSSRECVRHSFPQRFVLAVCLVVSGRLAHPAPRPVARP